jgi:hypothetical protein
MWVARFNAAGVLQKAVTYTGTLGFANPTALAVNPQGLAGDGGVYVVGAFTGNLTVGGVTISDQGNSDAFFVKLDGTTLAPAWDVRRFGGIDLDQLKSVATTSAGDAVMVGSIGTAPTTGAAVLTSAGSSDIVVLKVNGATGITDQALAYGSALTQTGDEVEVNRWGGDQVAFIGAISGTVSFGATAGNISAAKVSDAALVFARIQAP